MLIEELITAYAQHTVYLQRVGIGLGMQSIPFLQNIDDHVSSLFNKYMDRNLTPTLEQRIKDSIQSYSREQLQLYVAQLKSEHNEIGKLEALFASETLDDVVLNEDFNSITPTAAMVKTQALKSPIQLGEKSFTTYSSLMSNYWRKWSSEIDGIVSVGFAAGGTIEEISSSIYKQLRLTTNSTSSNVLTRAKRSARQLAVTGTNHYANQARVAFVDVNDDVLEGYRLISVIDSRTSQKCRALDNKIIPKDSKRLSQFTPPLHPNCRTAMVYEVSDKYRLDDDNSKRASNFEVDGKSNPKPVSSDGIYYDKMKSLSAADQDNILGPTLGRAFRKMNNPEEFAKATIDSLGNPLTIAEMRKKDNELGGILRSLRG